MLEFLGPRRIFGLVTVVGLISFDIFNYTTTQYALDNIMGKFAMWGVQASIALAIAFCMVDLGGLASLFTEERGKDEPMWVWAAAGGWLIASAINALLTWWALALTTRSSAIGSSVYNQEMLMTMLRWWPVILAAAVFLVRILLIGSTVAMWNGPKIRKPKPTPKPNFNPIGTRPVINKPSPVKSIEHTVNSALDKAAGSIDDFLAARASK